MGSRFAGRIKTVEVAVETLVTGLFPETRAILLSRISPDSTHHTHEHKNCAPDAECDPIMPHSEWRRQVRWREMRQEIGPHGFREGAGKAEAQKRAVERPRGGGCLDYLEAVVVVTSVNMCRLL